MTSLQQRPLPRFINDKLANPPAAGSGVHQWLLPTCAILKPWRSPEEIFRLLSEALANCGRRVTRREIADAIKNARSTWEPTGKFTKATGAMHSVSSPEPKRWPSPDLEMISEIERRGGTIEDLANLSPDKTGKTAAQTIASLWPHGDPLLCLARSHPADAVTRRRSAWLSDPESLSRHALIVPSPMSSPSGVRQDGKASVRCLDNTGPRWFLVIEFDFPPTESGRSAPDLCAGVLMHLLNQGAPLALAVHSGGKSIHGWFPTHGADDAVLMPFFRAAVMLGADPSTWTRCQLVRLPGGTRADGTHQRILFFNPCVLSAP